MSRWLVGWLGLALFGASVLVMQAQAGQLPRIMVASDNSGFRTETGRPFVPFGVTYYRPGTGWAPQVWKQFDAKATTEDFKRMKAVGVNCVRVFLSFGSFLPEPGKFSEDGFAKFDQFLAIAEQQGIYVHPTGPDAWEGLPSWAATDRYADESVLHVLENYWKFFAARYRGRTVIFAIDLLNEPSIGWDSSAMKPKWRAWVHEHYLTESAMKATWGAESTGPSYENPPAPPAKNAPKSKWLLDYQHFREGLADEFIRRQAEAVKSVDPNRLVSVGLIQWSVPSLLPSIGHYSAFRPSRIAPYLDFLEVHFYPLDKGFYSYDSAENEARNLAYLEGIVREVAAPGKPVVLSEFGWYGGGHLTIDRGAHPPATEEQQATWDKSVIKTSQGFATGWLNWGFYDQPEANDISQLIGLLTSDGKLKAWGREFRQLSRNLSGKKIKPLHVSRPALDWDACITDIAVGNKFREDYYRSYTNASVH